MQLCAHDEVHVLHVVEPVEEPVQVLPQPVQPLEEDVPEQVSLQVPPQPSQPLEEVSEQVPEQLSEQEPKQVPLQLPLQLESSISGTNLQETKLPPQTITPKIGNALFAAFLKNPLLERMSSFLLFSSINIKFNSLLNINRKEII